MRVNKLRVLFIFYKRGTRQRQVVDLYCRFYCRFGLFYKIIYVQLI